MFSYRWRWNLAPTLARRKNNPVNVSCKRVLSFLSYERDRYKDEIYFVCTLAIDSKGLSPAFVRADPILCRIISYIIQLILFIEKLINLMRLRWYSRFQIRISIFVYIFIKSILFTFVLVALLLLGFEFSNEILSTTKHLILQMEQQPIFFKLVKTFHDWGQWILIRVLE